MKAQAIFTDQMARESFVFSGSIKDKADSKPILKPAVFKMDTLGRNRYILGQLKWLK